MYRIEFDPRLDAWVLQLSLMGVLWRTVRGADAAPLTFATFRDARAHVAARELDAVYEYWTPAWLKRTGL